MAFGDRDHVPTAAESLVFDNFGDDPIFQGGGGDDGLQDDDAGLGAGLEDDDDDGSSRGKPLAFDQDSEGDDEDDLGDNVFRLRPEDDAGRDDRRELDDMRVTHTRKTKGLPRQAEVRTDRNGNIVDAKGKVIARAGAQARFYQNMRKAQREGADHAQRLTMTERRLNEAVRIGREINDELVRLRAGNDRVKEFGFEPEDQITAMQLYSDLRKDPKGTVTKILTKLAANGITLTGMNAGGGGGLDAKAILDEVRTEINKHMNPLKQRSDAEAADRRRQQQEDQGLRQVRGEVEGFFSRNPEARRYIPTFQRVMADPRYANMSLGEVYLRIRENDQNRRPSSSNRRRTPQAGSLPRGRSAPPSGGSGRGEALAPVDQSWDSLINGVLNDNGFRRAV